MLALLPDHKTAQNMSKIRYYETQHSPEYGTRERIRMGKKSFIDRLVFYSINMVIIYGLIVMGLSIRSKQAAESSDFAVGIDYMILYTAGKTAIAGNAPQIYDSPKQQTIIREDIGFDMPDDMHWFYPPTFLLAIVSLFSTIPFETSYVLWLAITLTLAVFACMIMVPRKKNLAILALSFPAVMHNFRWGQNGFLSTALLGAGIGLMESNPVLSGLFFGLLTFKPWLALFPFLMLLIARKWKVLGWSAFFSMLTVILSLVMYGMETWRAFFYQLFNTGPNLFTSIWEDTAAIQPSMQTALRLFGINGIPLYIILLFIGIFVTCLVALVFKTTNRLPLYGSAMVLGIFAVIPYFIEYDLMLLCIPTILLIYDCLQEGHCKADYIAIGALWLMPLINIPLVKMTRVQICPFVVIALLIYVYRRAKRTSKNIQSVMEH